MRAGGATGYKQPENTMQKVFENKGRDPMYVGGQMIPPGEIRMVEVPNEDPAPVEQPLQASLADAVADLLKLSVARVTEQLGGLSLDALEMMEVLEGQAKQPRKSLQAALAAEKLARASSALGGDEASDEAKAQAGEALAQAIADLQANEDPALDAELRARLLDAEDAARAAGVLVTHVDLAADGTSQ